MGKVKSGMHFFRLSVYPYHSEAYIGILTSTITGIIRILASASITARIPTATFHDILSGSILGRSPFPTVAPEVDTSAGTRCFSICIHGS